MFANMAELTKFSFTISFCVLLCFFVLFFFACTCVCVTCAYSNSMFGLSFPSFHIILSSTNLSSFSSRRLQKKKIPISIIQHWCPRTQQASTFSISSETAHFSFNDWLQTQIKDKPKRIIKRIFETRNVPAAS